jgi:hypothetical protein
MIRIILAFVICILLGISSLYAQPIVVDGGTSFTPTVPLAIDYTSNTYVYRATTEIIFKAGFSSAQTGGTTTNYFLAYINVPNTSAIFAELKEEQDDSYTIALNSVLTFKYEEKYNVAANTPLNFVIYDYKMNPMTCLGLTKKYGSNYLSLNLIGYNFIHNQYYTLVVTGEKGEKKYLRFKYQGI